MKCSLAEDVRVIFPEAALMAVFDECDRFDQDETGGRVIGTFAEVEGQLVLNISGIIEPGPNARRTAVSFFQDGKHQERIFRRIESSHAEIEHLGNWHTHHVNGLLTLSGGDLDTYHRTVNHRSHNPPFFFALLVTARNQTKEPLRRYSVKHYLFRRGDQRVFEIPEGCVEVVKAPIVWPEPLPASTTDHPQASTTPASQQVRVFDRDILKESYRGIRPFTSSKLGLFWRGRIELVDGSEVEIVIVEDTTSSTFDYSIVLRNAPEPLKGVSEDLAERKFASACAAVITTERHCNRALYGNR